MKQKIRLGLYGCGNRTQALLDSIRMEDAYEVVAAYDIRREATVSACEKYGGKVCASSAELVAHSGVDAFMISLDPFAHPPAFFETLEAGRPIFIEKPIAMTAETAYKMMTAAEEKNVPVQVGFMRRYRAQHLAARKFLAEHEIGTLFSVFVSWFHAGETEMINCLTNCPDNFRLKVSQIPFHCCHSLDVMLLYGGNVKAVTAVGRKVIDRPYPSPDEVIANVEFENGAIGCFHYSSMAYQGGRRYLIHSENYTLAMDDPIHLTITQRPPIKSLREDGSRDCRPLYNSNTFLQQQEFGSEKIDHLIMLDFLNSVRTGVPMTAPIRDGYKVAEFAEAIERSWQEERRIELPMEFE